MPSSPRTSYTALMHPHTRQVELRGQEERCCRIWELTCMFAAVSLEFSEPFSWLAPDPAISILLGRAFEVVCRSLAVRLSRPLCLAA
jgi:hypothetical protein